jgi:paraquat-inducible protein B
MIPKAPPYTITREGDAMVLPSQGGGLDGLMADASQVLNKVNAIPFDQIGDNLNKLLVTVNGTVGGDQVKTALTSLSQTLQSAQHLVAKVDQGLTPALKQLPTLMTNLSGTLRNTNLAVGQLARGYGNDSDFQRNLAQLMDQADGALRSIKELATFLDRHPESLILGRSGHATGGQ